MLKDVADKQMVPGYYETYNAMQVKSSQWDPQKVTIRPDGTWNAANDQAYMHKMWAFPDWEQEYFKKRHQKFQPRRTGYVDGFTSRLPFMYNDYDHRYPEAGKMIDTIRGSVTHDFASIYGNLVGGKTGAGSPTHFFRTDCEKSQFVTSVKSKNNVWANGLKGVLEDIEASYYMERN